MNVDRNEKIWAPANTGTKVHAFVQVWKNKDGEECPSYLRAMCRGTIARTANTRFIGRNQNHGFGVCTRCEALAEAMWDRDEASMEPATESHDLGEVAELDLTTRVPTQVVRWDAPVTRSIQHLVDLDHTEALAIQAEMDAQAADMEVVKEALNSPDVIDALHAEALAMYEADGAAIDRFILRAEARIRSRTAS